jgi:hypothetical protein
MTGVITERTRVDLDDWSEDERIGVDLDDWGEDQ